MFRNKSGLTTSHFRGAIIHILWTTCLVSVGVQDAFGLDASNVLVLYNNESPDGIEIAYYYAQMHPGVTLLGLDDIEDSEQISQAHYLEVIRPQVLQGITDHTQVIITTKGMPLRISNEVENPGTYSQWRGNPFNIPILEDWWEKYSSLESELTRITRINSAEMMGDQAYFMSPPTFPFETLHHAANPYYNAGQAFDSSTPGYDGMRLTARLDGFTVDDVFDSLNRAKRALMSLDGQVVVVDDDPDAPAAYVDRMASLGFNVLEPNEQAMIFDNTDVNIKTSSDPVIGYVSHGSHAAGRDYIDKLDFELADGAVFHTWESYNAYSFIEGNNKYGQGLIGEWLEAGGTAAVGHVHEPGASVSTVTNEDILWYMLLQGYTFAEAAWAATPQLSFVNTVVGDPLMQLHEWVTGDVNMDGIVGLDDLHIVLSKWNQVVEGGAFDGDVYPNGYIGLDDLDLIIKYWNSNDQPPAASASLTPEPSTLALAVTGLLLFIRRS